VVKIGLAERQGKWSAGMKTEGRECRAWGEWMMGRKYYCFVPRALGSRCAGDSEDSISASKIDTAREQNWKAESGVTDCEYQCRSSTMFH